MLTDSTVRVLVIDDEPCVRVTLVEYLEDCGYWVAAAASAEEASKLLASTPCDIAIVDLRLPGVSGDAFILDVRERFPRMRFLIHTGSVDYRLSANLRRAGICERNVFLKPLADLTILTREIENLLEP